MATIAITLDVSIETDGDVFQATRSTEFDAGGTTTSWLRRIIEEVGRMREQVGDGLRAQATCPLDLPISCTCGHSTDGWQYCRVHTAVTP